MKVRRFWGLCALVATVTGACGGPEPLEVSETPTTRDRFPAMVVPTSAPAPTTPFGGSVVAPRTPKTTTTAKATPSGGATTSAPVTAAPRVAPQATPMPSPRTAVGTTAWQGVVVVAGGYDVRGEVSARVDSYDPSTGLWSRAPSLPRPLHHVGLVVLGEDLWVIGGFSVEGDQSIARAETYLFRPGGTAWIPGPALDTPRGAVAVADLGGRLIVVGGATTDGAALDSVETLARGATEWVDGAPLAQKRAYAAAVVGGGRIWVAGGRVDDVGSSLRGVESWKPGENWRPELALKTRRSSAAASGLCIAGGENDEGAVASVECIAARQWSTRFTLALPRYGLGAATVGGWLHVIGGSPSGGKTVTNTHEIFDLS